MLVIMILLSILLLAIGLVCSYFAINTKNYGLGFVLSIIGIFTLVGFAGDVLYILSKIFS